MNNDLISRTYLLDLAEKQNNLLDGGDVRSAPSVEAVPVVRCIDCVYYDRISRCCEEEDGRLFAKPTDFCSYGKQIERVTE